MTAKTAPDRDRLAAGLAQTLNAILRRYHEHCIELRDAERARQQSGQPAQEWAVHKLSDWADRPIPPRWMDAINGVARDPMRVALRAEAREIGWRAYNHGGTDFMREVSGLAEDAGADPNIIDKWWDNIGGPGMRGGWWCS
jgi:hypothetical protein